VSVNINFFLHSCGIWHAFLQKERDDGANTDAAIEDGGEETVGQGK